MDKIIERLRAKEKRLEYLKEEYRRNPSVSGLLSDICELEKSIARTKGRLGFE